MFLHQPLKIHLTVLRSGLCESVCTNVHMPSCLYATIKSDHCVAASVLLSPHQRAGQHVAACLTTHCACPRHLPWLLDVGGGEGLQQGRKDPSGNPGRAGRETKNIRRHCQDGGHWCNKSLQALDNLDDLMWNCCCIKEQTHTGDHMHTLFHTHSITGDMNALLSEALWTVGGSKWRITQKHQRQHLSGAWDGPVLTENLKD